MQCILRCPICKYSSADGKSENLGVHVIILQGILKEQGLLLFLPKITGALATPAPPVSSAMSMTL
jgi:hypothetical protein